MGWLRLQPPLGDLVAYHCANQNTSAKSGELLTYKAYYNWKFVWIPAGEVTFSMVEDSTAIHLKAIGKSYPSYDNFFRVNDYYATTVDKETMLPKTFVRRIEEGEYRKYDSLTFHHDTMMVQSVNGTTKAEAVIENFAIDSCALDLLSVMYSLRNVDVSQYDPGDYLDITMFIDKEVYPIHVIYADQENKKVKDLGKFEALRIQPQLIVGNVFKEGDVMNIWVSDDDNKVPLLIESPVSVGSVKAVLKSFKNLRSDGHLVR